MPENDTQNKAPSVPGRNGGTLNPWQPGQSGNPGGRPQYKRITEAYNRLLDLDAEDLEKYKPKTVAELVALGQVKTAIGDSDGAPRTPAAKEIADRVEGKAKETVEHQGLDGVFSDVAKRLEDERK